MDGASPYIELSERIIECAIEVHRELGPGLLESIYQDAFGIELAAAGLSVATGVRVPVVYKGRRLSDDLKLDLLVDDVIIVEIKAVEGFHPVHLAQLITYLKLAERPKGLLINFNTTSLRLGGLRAAFHPTLYKKKKE
jgi:GxxExxY protein